MLIPILYLKGISTGDFEEALAALLGKDAPGLSASTIARLKEVWTEEHAHWRKRDLSAKRYVYFWADGIHLEARLEDAKRSASWSSSARRRRARRSWSASLTACARARRSWRELLLDLQNARPVVAPELAVADGALGFWKALGEVWPTTREQRCWVHKTANVLNKLPKSQQRKAKRALQEIWMAETKKDADRRVRRLHRQPTMSKYDKAADCLAKDRDALLAFYDFPAEHWKHCERRTRSRAPLRPCDTARSDRRAACQTRQRSPWSSSSSRRRRKAGAGSTATTSCQSSSKV